MKPSEVWRLDFLSGWGDPFGVADDLTKDWMEKERRGEKEE